MTIWDDQFESHPGVQAVSDMMDLLPKLPAAPNVRSAEYLARIDHAIRYVATRIEAANRLLMTPDQIAALEEAPYILGELKAFAGDTSFDLETASNRVDAVLGGVSTWPGPYPTKAYSGQSAADYRNRMGALVTDLENKIEPLSGRVDELSTDVDAAEARVAERATAAQEAIDAASTKAISKITASEAALEVTRGRVDDAIRAATGQFSDEQNKRNDQWNDFLSDQRARAEEVAAEVSAASVAHLDSMNRDEEAARGLLDVISSNGMSTGFGKYAEEERQTANQLRTWGLLVILAGVAFGTVQLYFLGEHIGDWVWLGGRLLVLLPIGLLAFILFNQSGLHRTNEVRARQSQLDFAAIDPFINRLDKNKQEELKMALASRAFFRVPDKAGDGDLTERDALDAIVDIVKALRGK